MINLRNRPEAPNSYTESVQRKVKKPNITERSKRALFEYCLGKCYLCERLVHLENSEVEHRKPKGSTDYSYEESHDWRNLFIACGKCNRARTPIENNQLSVLDPGTDDVEAKLHQIYDDDENLVTFEAKAKNDDVAVNTALELTLVHYKDSKLSVADGVANVICCELYDGLSSDLQSQSRRLMRLVAKYIDAVRTQNDVAARHNKTKLRKILSRKAPFTALMRSVLETNGLLLDLLPELYD